MAKPVIDLFLDSGAYSAWSHGETLPVRDYIKFVQDTKHALWAYVNMDVIPGGIDRTRTRDEVEASAAASYRNLQIMKDAGLSPVPVFHQGEDFSWLDKMLRDGEKFIGISSAKNQPMPVQDAWLDKFFNVITDDEGRPLVKVHGFGVAHTLALKRHPYYSIDSAGWRIAAAYGKMYVPVLKNGTFDYLARPELISMSGNYMDSVHAQTRQIEQSHFNGPSHREVMQKFLQEEVKSNLGGARYSDRIRYRALAVFYQRVSEAIRNIRFVDRGSGFMMKSERDCHTYIQRHRKPVKFDHLRFIFSSAYDADCCAALLEADATNHLLSYYEMRKWPDRIIGYAMEGKIENQRPPTGVKRDWKNRRYLAHRGRVLARMALEAEREAR